LYTPTGLFKPAANWVKARLTAGLEKEVVDPPPPFSLLPVARMLRSPMVSTEIAAA
jgi:hypothetical protein